MLKNPYFLLGISIVLGVTGQFLFKHGLNTITGSSEIALSHIKDPVKLISRLKKAGDPAALLVYNSMSSEAQSLLQNYNEDEAPSQELLEITTVTLNNLLKGSSLLEEEAFKNTPLSPSVKKLSENSKPGSTFRLNKILLVQSFSEELNPGGIELTPQIIFIFFTPYIFLGLSLYVLSTFTWLSGLSKVPLSIAYPLLSTGYLIIFIISVLFLGEKYTHAKLIANLLIIGGISLMFYGKQ